MFSKLLRRKASVRAPENPCVPAGRIVWAIGDIHGRLDLLRPLVEAIRADAAGRNAAHTTVVFLGDYIDRGPDSRGVIRYLGEISREEGIEWRFLKGNHEEAMLRFLDDPSSGQTWCEYGGDATLRSYGLHPPGIRHKAEPWAHLSADLDHKLSTEERSWLIDLEDSVTVGDYFFVHAGARPGVSLELQSSDDMLWIRKSFLESDLEFERIVVHGHTPTANVHVDHRRIGVDTKAYASGVLSAVRLQGDSCELLHTEIVDGHVSIREASLQRQRRAAA